MKWSIKLLYGFMVLLSTTYLILSNGCSDRDFNPAIWGVTISKAEITRCNERLPDLEEYSGLRCIKWRYNENGNLVIYLTSFMAGCFYIASYNAYIKDDELILELISENGPFVSDDEIWCISALCICDGKDMHFELSGFDESRIYKLIIIYRECNSSVFDTGIEIKYDLNGEIRCEKAYSP